MQPAPETLSGHCGYGPSHDEDRRDRPAPVVMVSTRHVEETEACPSSANVKLCRDCAEDHWVVDE